MKAESHESAVSPRRHCEEQSDAAISEKALNRKDAKSAKKSQEKELDNKFLKIVGTGFAAMTKRAATQGRPYGISDNLRESAGSADNWF